MSSPNGAIDSSIVYDQPFQPEILGKRFSLSINMYFHFIAGRTQVDVDGSTVTVQLEDVLMWLTGARMVPAVGFNRKIKVYFDQMRTTPKVHTCAPFIILPIRDELMRGRLSVSHFINWIVNSQGFGQT